MTATPDGASYCPGCGPPQVPGVTRPTGEATPIAIPFLTAVRAGFAFALGAALVGCIVSLTLAIVVAISVRF
jgi:hypothetical protein